MYVTIADYRDPHAAQDFTASLRKTGFAVLSHHPVSQDLVESVYEEWAEFFGNQNKFDYLFDPNAIPQSGYFPFKSENAKGYPIKDLKEFYHYYGMHTLPKGMGPKTQLLMDKMVTLAEELLQWIEKNLPEDIQNSLSMPLHKMIRNSNMSLLRVLHYPPLSQEDDGQAVRAAAHEDIDLLTMLPSATAQGLQVLDRIGKWHDVPCDYGMLIFNAGDMLQMATKGYYRSTTHRVMNPKGAEAQQSRFSLPLFLHPRNEVQLSEVHTAGSYLVERLQEIGLKPGSKVA